MLRPLEGEKRVAGDLAVGIPTCCHTAEDIRLGYVLEALAMQPKTSRLRRLFVHIWDEGKYPVVTDRWVRLMIDLLIETGHSVNYMRRWPSRGVALARYGLLDEISKEFPFILMIDDDLVPMPGAIEAILSAKDEVKDFGFLQGAKIELDKNRIYENDINQLNRAEGPTKLVPLVFGDGAFLLLKREALASVKWDVVTRFRDEGLAGEDVAMSLMIADQHACYGVPEALGYHLSLAEPRWTWEAASDALQYELLKGVVSEETLRSALSSVNCIDAGSGSAKKK